MQQIMRVMWGADHLKLRFDLPECKEALDAQASFLDRHLGLTSVGRECGSMLHARFPISGNIGSYAADSMVRRCGPPTPPPARAADSDTGHRYCSPRRAIVRQEGFTASGPASECLASFPMLYGLLGPPVSPGVIRCQRPGTHDPALEHSPRSALIRWII